MHTCTLIRRGFNDHYLIQNAQTNYVYRVYLNGKYYIDSPEAFQFELALLEHLRHEGIPVASAIRTKEGTLLGWTETPLGKRAFTLFPFAAGEELSGEAVSVEQSRAFGKTVAAFHLAADRFKPNHERYRLDLKYLMDEPLSIFAEQDAETSDVLSKEEIEEVQAMIDSLGPLGDVVKPIQTLGFDSDVFGIIHGDLHPGNMRFQKDEVILFDFDHCAYGWRVYDLATSLYLPEKQRNAFFEGYESLRPLSQQERECLPIFAKLRDLWDVGDILATTEVRALPKS